MNDQPYRVPGVNEAMSSVGAAAYVAPRRDDPHMLFLTAPITTHQGQTNRLPIREPKAADYIEMERYPFRIIAAGTDKQELDINFKQAARWLARLTDTDEIIIGQLSRRDFVQGVEKVISIVASTGDDLGN